MSLTFGEQRWIGWPLLKTVRNVHEIEMEDFSVTNLATVSLNVGGKKTLSKKILVLSL